MIKLYCCIIYYYANVVVVAGENTFPNKTIGNNIIDKYRIQVSGATF